jgi:hypothetical protein
LFSLAQERVSLQVEEIRTVRNVCAAVLWLGELGFDAKGAGICVSLHCCSSTTQAGDGTQLSGDSFFAL